MRPRVVVRKRDSSPPHEKIGCFIIFYVILAIVVCWWRRLNRYEWSARMKRFNVTGTCYPEDHYMVDISERLEIIAQMIGRGDYFCINAGRQYGKTTTLYQLKKKPIINGVGNYYIEAQTRDETRTDVIIDYLGHQYIIELKIWRENAYNERGEEQIAGYLDYYHAKKGYLVSFCFNKNKVPGTKTIQVGDKTVTEAVI